MGSRVLKGPSMRQSVNYFPSKACDRRAYKKRNGRKRYKRHSSFQSPIARPASYVVTWLAPRLSASARARLRRMAGAYVSGTANAASRVSAPEKAVMTQASHRQPTRSFIQPPMRGPRTGPPKRPTPASVRGSAISAGEKRSDAMAGPCDMLAEPNQPR